MAGGVNGSVLTGGAGEKEGMLTFSIEALRDDNSTRLSTLVTTFEMVETCSCKQSIAEIRNLRLYFSALTWGRRFGSPATNCLEVTPVLVVSITTQMSIMSFMILEIADSLPFLRGFLNCEISFDI